MVVSAVASGKPRKLLERILQEILPLSQMRPTLRERPSMKNLMDARIDAYIALNPKHWRGIQAMDRQRLERTLVALYVQRQEAHERKKAKSSNTHIGETA